MRTERFLCLEIMHLCLHHAKPDTNTAFFKRANKMHLGTVGYAEEEISLSSQLLLAIRLIPDLCRCCYITRVEFWLKTHRGQTILKLPAVLPNYCSGLQLLKALLCSLSCSASALPGLGNYLCFGILQNHLWLPSVFMLTPSLWSRPLLLLSHKVFMDFLFKIWHCFQCNTPLIKQI